MPSLTGEALVQGVLEGNRRALARAITLVENQQPEAQALLTALYPHSGRAAVVGITGAPGTGKSTLVNALAQHIRQQGHSVGIIAVDPTSPFSQGAVLGDRIRMRDLAGDSGVFIRSMASRGSLGGLARSTADVIRVLDAAGYAFILVETVGAGQSEVAIASAAHTTIVVDAPGLGDDIQATKAGILEIADILVVNKADRPGADNAVRSLKAMLDLGHRMKTVLHHGTLMEQIDRRSTLELDSWQPPVLRVTAAENEGITRLYEAILEHREHLQTSGMGQEREAARLRGELLERAQAQLLQQLLAATPPENLDALVQGVAARDMTPAQAVAALLKGEKV